MFVAYNKQTTGCGTARYRTFTALYKFIYHGCYRGPIFKPKMGFGICHAMQRWKLFLRRLLAPSWLPSRNLDSEQMFLFLFLFILSLHALDYELDHPALQSFYYLSYNDWTLFHAVWEFSAFSLAYLVVKFLASDINRSNQLYVDNPSLVFTFDSRNKGQGYWG